MKLQEYNPILYLEDYESIPDEIYRWKEDEELRPAPGWGGSAATLEGPNQTSVPERLCVGIGQYHTEQDREIYLCVLLNRDTRSVESCSFGVYRSPELVAKALDIFFRIYPITAQGLNENSRNTAFSADFQTGTIPQISKKISLLSSRNAIYQKKDYLEMISRYHVQPEMTVKGTRGGASVVSTYFSQLMRRKGCTIFYTWQDAIDWLSADIVKYNQKIKRVYI